jgi:hypothetical protein
LAYIERRRSSILEDINGSRPLDEIIEQITELVSFRLQGTPCWCQITGGAQLGNYLPKLSALRIVEEKIPARSGPPLGTIVAAFDALTKPRASESEALPAAAALAALAIETRRLYSDLRRRSEFDQLTNIHNRFSIEGLLDVRIDAARAEGGIFGLIFIDLDKFKEVNDRPVVRECSESPVAFVLSRWPAWESRTVGKDKSALRRGGRCGVGVRCSPPDSKKGLRRVPDFIPAA